jgi:hypothetical protein
MDKQSMNHIVRLRIQMQRASREVNFELGLVGHKKWFFDFWVLRISSITFGKKSKSEIDFT